MEIRKKYSIRPFAVFVLLLFAPSATRAQSVFLGPHKPTGISIEWNKPSFDGDGLSFLTSSMFITGIFKLSDGIRGVIELPLSYTGSTEDLKDDIFGTGVGNPYLGLSTERDDSKSWTEVGVRLPLTSGNGWQIAGAFGNPNRFGSFGEDLWSIGGALNSQIQSGPVLFHLRLHPNLLVPTGSGGGDSEMFVHYSGFAWLAESQVEVGVGIQGWTLLTEKDLSFGERSIHEFGIAARVNLKSVIIGLRTSIPLDSDYKDFVNNIIGFNATIPIPGNG